MNARSLVRRIVDERTTYLFLLPVFAFFSLFVVRSVFVVGYYSLFSWSGTGRMGAYIGLANFIEVMSDPYFWNAFRNTFVFMFGVVPGQLGFGLLLALLLNSKSKRSTIYRTVYFLPVVTTTAIVGMIAPLLFSPINGPVNVFLQSIGLLGSPVDWLGDRSTALRTVITVSIWKHSGMYMVYWLAALQTIPEELYEAAMVEGAGPLRRFWSVTLPLLVPIGSVITLLCVIGSLKPFDLIKTMTNGGPFFSTDVVMTYVYRYAFSADAGIPRIGYASAAAIFYGLVLIALAAVQTFIVGKARGGQRSEAPRTAAMEGAL
jgi:ABC-type sugar transport system permease subunit